jgi:hypothetical protein
MKVHAEPWMARAGCISFALIGRGTPLCRPTDQGILESIRTDELKLTSLTSSQTLGTDITHLGSYELTSTLMLTRRFFRTVAWASFTSPTPLPSTSCQQWLCPFATLINLRHTRLSSSSSKRWQNRQGRDRFAREAKVRGLRSRAAFKLLEVHTLHPQQEEEADRTAIDQ